MPIVSPPAGPPTAPARSAPRARLALALVLPAWALGACGYGMERPGLPNQRQSIGVGPIRNLTYEGERDVRPARELWRRLFQDAAIRVSDLDRSELVLTVEIQQLTLSRARNLDSTDVLSLSLSLAGSITLRDAITGQFIYDEQSVSATTRYDLPEAATETPAVRDDAIDDVIAAFADSVMQQLLATF